MIITVNDSESRFIGMKNRARMKTVMVNETFRLHKQCIKTPKRNTVAVNQHDFFSHENSLLSSQNLYTRR